MKTNFILILLCGFIVLFANGQTLSPDVKSPAGNYFKQPNGSLDWTIGQTAITTIGNNNNILTQGFHQGSFTVYAVDENANLDFQIMVYPNPSEDFVNIELQTNKIKTFQYSVFDNNSKEILKKDCSVNKENIDFRSIATGEYFLKIYDNKTLLKTFRIVKLK